MQQATQATESFQFFFISLIENVNNVDYNSEKLFRYLKKNIL